MKLLVATKTKKQEKAVKNFLESENIDFSMVKEYPVTYRKSKTAKLTAKEKQILSDLSSSVEFVKKYSQGKTKAKSIKQLLDEL
jgi:hypothetical protein